MKHVRYNNITIVLAVLLLVSGELCANTDSLRYCMPLSITANRGQWDDQVRYAIIGDGSALWFCDDEILIERPAEMQAMPGESPGREHASVREVIRIAFPSRSPQFSLQALDTLRGVANFYRNNDRSVWFESVPTHGGIRYTGIAEGVDLEIRCDQDFSHPISASAERRYDRIEWDVTAAKQLSPQPVALISNGSRQLRSWLDAQELHSFLLSLGQNRSSEEIGLTFRGIAAENETIVFLGSTNSPDFPVRNAFQDSQGSKRDSLDHVVICCDAVERFVRFSTFLGSDGNDGEWPPLMSGFNYQGEETRIRIRSGDIFLGLVGRAGFPIIRNLPDASLPEWPTSQAVLAILDTAGHLTASTFLGGPGVVNPYSIMVDNGKLYFSGGVDGKPLRQITTDAVETHANIANWGNQTGCGYFAVLTSDLDSLLYATYIDPTSKQGGWMNANHSLKFSVTEKSEGVLFMTPKIYGDNNTTALINSIMSREDLYEGIGAYVVKLSPSLDSYEFATCLGFPDRQFHPGGVWSDENGGAYIAGFAYRMWGEADTFNLPGIWRRYSAVGGYNKSLAVFHLSPTGELQGGLELGMNSLGKIEYIGPDPCGGITVIGTLDGNVDGVRIPLINAIDTTRNWWRNGNWEQCIVSFDTQTMEPYLSSFWNHRYVRSGGTGSRYLYPRANGYMLWSEVYKDKTPLYPGDWHMLGPVDQIGYCAVDIRIPTPCWTILCDIKAPDTLRIERRRGYAVPQAFDVHYEVSNASTLKQAQILQALIEVPPGFELVSGQPAQPMTPAYITPGTSATCTWRIQVTNAATLADTALIRCRVMYYDPESGETYPAAEELCEKDIVVVRFDEEDPNLVCTVAGPDSLYWRGTVYSPFPDGNPGPVKYSITLTNLESDTIDITSFYFSALENCSIVGGPVRPGIRLAPGASHVIPIEVEVKAMPYARMIRVEADARDSYDVPISSCATETHVPDVLDLRCSVTGPTQIRWYPKSGLAYPGLLTLTLHLDNPLDTVRTDVRAWVDTSSAPHLSLAGGEVPARAPVDIGAGASYDPYWRFVLAHPPSSPARDTIRFIYETGGVLYECAQMIAIDVILIEKSVQCDLNGTDSLSITQIQSRAPAQLHYTLTNTGTVTVDVDRYELSIISGAGFTAAGLTSFDSLIRSGGTIDPGNDITLDWTLRALILRESRPAQCSVTAFDANDSVLSVCTHDIFLGGLDGLVCTLSADDTVRFKRADLRYEPEAVTADFTLDNLLDTEETNIEAIVNLTQAPRFVLGSSESASKTIAVIDSHATANLAWQLVPQKASTSEDQEIIVRYRSDQQTEWKQCSVMIHIEAWPEEAAVTCETGGHDSLYADPHYERYIPDPLFVSYTVTNTGTIALTGCEASIVLPVEFSLAGSDSTQVFTSPAYGNQPGGPVPPGTLLPNATCTRWWMVTPTSQLASSGPFPISWIWNDNQQGSGEGCSSTIEVVPDSPGSIVLSPLHLYFEAERGGPLPPEQHVQLWTGGGLAMPWTMQPLEWWLDAQPMNGNQEAMVAVQPNSTILDVGAHGAELLLSSTPTDRRVTVTYVVRKSTGISEAQAPGAFTLDVWPQPVPGNGVLRIRIKDEAGRSYQVTLHDFLGRERFTFRTEAQETITLHPATLQLAPGPYLLRARNIDGRSVSKMITILR